MTTHGQRGTTHTHSHSSGPDVAQCARRGLAQMLLLVPPGSWGLPAPSACGRITPTSASGHRASPPPSALAPAQPLLPDNYRTPTISTEPQVQALISRPPAVPISTEHLSWARRQGWEHSGEQSKQTPHLLEPKVQWADGPQPSQQPAGHGPRARGRLLLPAALPARGSCLELSFTHAHCD